jgi:hypothetical protein
MAPKPTRLPHESRARFAASPDRRRAHKPSSIRATRPSHPQLDRRTAIAKALALWPHELEDESGSGRERVLAQLRQALRAERRRGLAGHWAYDLARHVELLRVYREELAAVAGSGARAPCSTAAAATKTLSCMKP